MKLTTEQQVERLREYVSSVKENRDIQLSLVRRAENAERELEQERRERTAEILRAVEREERYVAQITQLEMDKEYLTKRLAGMKQAIHDSLSRDGCRCDTSVCRWCETDGWVQVSPTNAALLRHVLKDADHEAPK